MRTPNCCYERVLQDLDLVCGLPGSAPVRCSGDREVAMDVHKKVIWVAVRLPGPGPGDRKVIVKSFRTFWRSLLALSRLGYQVTLIPLGDGSPTPAQEPAA